MSFFFLLPFDKLTYAAVVCEGKRRNAFLSHLFSFEKRYMVVLHTRVKEWKIYMCSVYSAVVCEGKRRYSFLLHIFSVVGPLYDGNDDEKTDGQDKPGPYGRIAIQPTSGGRVFGQRKYSLERQIRKKTHMKR